MADPKSFFLTPEIHEYVVAHGTPPDAVQQALIDETAALADGDACRSRPSRARS